MDQHFVIQHLYLIPIMPLIGAVISGFFGAKWLKGQSHWPIWIGVGASAVMSIWLLCSMLTPPAHQTSKMGMGHAILLYPNTQSVVQQNPLTVVKNYFPWVQAGAFRADWGYFVDPLTAVMLCVVCGIGFLITVFSAGYMKGEEGYWRFFAYLGLFIFMMTNLVMGENLLMLYLGWEGVGLCSYLLIGYYYEKPAAREAAKKAFLVNRVGDFGFALGIMLCFLAFGTISYFGAGVNTHTGLLEKALVGNGAGNWALKYIPFLLMLGAFGKSAQFPLYVWLPDAMEGPTPVSALIHAATMVTAGVYMIARCGTLFVGNTAAMWTIAIVGAFTALFAATIALRQFDLKKVFAYSTISQLGFMFTAVGCFAPIAGVFHLITHAFFKALLFLSSGVVMHAMSGELDMRKMSGLKRVLPKTNILMLIGCLALSGAPFLGAGFFSKDEIVSGTWEQSKILAISLLVTAFLTAYYTFRLYFRVFQGPEIIPPPPRETGHHTDDPHGSAALTTGAHHADVDEHLKHAPHGHDSPGHDSHGHDSHGHNHEPAVMMLPLIVLAIGAFFAGYINWPSERLGNFLEKSPSIAMAMERASEHVAPVIEDRAAVEQRATFHRNMMIVSGLISLLGIYLAYLNHLQNRRRAEQIARAMPEVTSLLEHKYWVDEIYQAGIVEPLRMLGVVLAWIDRNVVDFIVDAFGFTAQGLGVILKVIFQRGYLQGYALSMLLGIAIILLLMFM